MKLQPRFEGYFADYTQWVSFASRWLTGRTGNRGEAVSAMCVDTLGRRCNIGADFMRARDEGTFPVYFFWDCEPHKTTETHLSGPAVLAETEGQS